MRLRRPRGFALLEATAALFVATIGVFGVVQLFDTAADEIRTAHEKEIAGRILRNEMEYLSAQSFGNLAPGVRNSLASPAPELEHLHAANPSIEIESHAELQETLRVVTVRLRWITTHGRRVEQSLTTLIAREDR